MNEPSRRNTSDLAAVPEPRSRNWPTQPQAGRPGGGGDDPEQRSSAATWSWRDLWRHGGAPAAVVVAAAFWLLAALWFASNGAPSAGGDPPDLVVIEPEPTLSPLSDDPVPTVASGASGTT